MDNDKMQRMIKFELKRSFKNRLFLISLLISLALVTWYPIERLPYCLQLNSEFLNDENLNDEKRSLKYDLEGIQKEYSALISDNFSHIMAYDLLKNLEKWAEFEEKSENEKDIPFVISELKKLLKNKECD